MVREGADGTHETGGLPKRRTFRVLLRNREYAGLLGSRLVSIIGDQVAWVALVVLVFDRTGNGLLAALAYGASVFPAALSPLVSGVSDRWPRRRILVTTDLLRGGIFALMALPGVPWGMLIVLVAVATLAEGPHDAARAPLVRAVLTNEGDFRAATALDEMTEQPGQIIGFLVAGLLLEVAGPRAALLIDAGSFVASAALVLRLVANRPAATRSTRGAGTGIGSGLGSALADARLGVTEAFAPTRRMHLLLCWVAASALIAPDALVAPWASQLHVGDLGIGLLLAVPGSAILVTLSFVGRGGGRHAQYLEIALVGVTLLPLTLCALEPPFPVLLAILGLSAAGSTFTVLTRVALMTGLSDEVSGRMYSVASGGLRAGQGICVVLAGALSQAFGPAHAIALIAGAASLGSVVIVLASGRSTQDVVIVLPDFGAAAGSVTIVGDAEHGLAPAGSHFRGTDHPAAATGAGLDANGEHPIASIV